MNAQSSKSKFQFLEPIITSSKGFNFLTSFCEFTDVRKIDISLTSLSNDLLLIKDTKCTHIHMGTLKYADLPPLH